MAALDSGSPLFRPEEPVVYVGWKKRASSDETSPLSRDPSPASTAVSARSASPTVDATEKREINPISYETAQPYSIIARIGRAVAGIFVVLLSLALLGLPFAFKSTRLSINSLFNDTALKTSRTTLDLPCFAKTRQEFVGKLLSTFPSVGSTFTLPYKDVDPSANPNPTCKDIRAGIEQIVADLVRQNNSSIDGIVLPLPPKEVLQTPENVAAGKRTFSDVFRSMTDEEFKDTDIYRRILEVCDIPVNRDLSTPEAAADRKKIYDFVRKMHQGGLSGPTAYMLSLSSRIHPSESGTFSDADIGAVETTIRTGNFTPAKRFDNPLFASAGTEATHPDGCELSVNYDRATGLVTANSYSTRFERLHGLYTDPKELAVFNPTNGMVIATKIVFDPATGEGTITFTRKR